MCPCLIYKSSSLQHKLPRDIPLAFCILRMALYIGIKFIQLVLYLYLDKRTQAYMMIFRIRTKEKIMSLDSSSNQFSFCIKKYNTLRNVYLLFFWMTEYICITIKSSQSINSFQVNVRFYFRFQHIRDLVCFT